MSGGEANDVWTNIGLGCLAGVAAVGGLAWTAATLTASVTDAERPGGFGSPWLLFEAPGDPGRAWGIDLSVWVFWSLFVALVLIVGASAVGVWLRLSSGRAGRTGGSGGDPYRRRPESWPGLASRREVAAAAGPKVLAARAPVLRPGLADPDLGDVGFHIGSSRGVAAWASVEDSVMVVGPPRSGKGLHLAINAILDAPGAVITTGTRPDNIAPTLVARSVGPNGQMRPVMIFDPQHLAEGLPRTGPPASLPAGTPGGSSGTSLRWSLIGGCEDSQRAMSRAAVLVGQPGKGVDGGSFWSQQCETATRCLLHAAALGGRSTLELYEWSLSVTAARKAVDILAAHPGTARGWTRALSAILDADPRQRDSVWAMVSNTFAVLADPRVLEAVSPREDEVFDADEFLEAAGTAYLLGTASGAAATATLVAAFVDDVVEAGRRRAARSRGFRLDPPLALVLDEAANYPLAGLPALMSEGGGTGISTWVFVQSLAQARSQWGRDDADAIWDAAIVKIVLGGGGHADDLGDLSQLLGKRSQTRSSVSYGTRDSSRSWSESDEDRAVLEAAQIRRIPFGYALLVLRTAAPIMLGLRRWTDRSDAAQLQAARASVESAMLGGHDLRPAIPLERGAR